MEGKVFNYMAEKKRGQVYNRFFTEEEWLLVNEENKFIMQDFLDEYKQQKKKKTTLDQYKNDIRIILIYIKNFCENRSIFELNKKDFRRLSIYFGEEKGMSNARVNRLMSTIRSMLTYCENDDDTDYENNVAKKVRGLPKEAVRTDEDNFFMTFEQIMRIREEILRRGDLQLAVLHMVLFDSGARRNEVFQVKKQGLLDGNKTNVVVGKRGKMFPLVYLTDTRELIAKYLEERGEDDIDLLWTLGKGVNKRASSYETIYERVLTISKIFSELEGKEIHIFPHSYRHSKCEAMLQGTDSRIIDKNTGKPKIFTLEQVQTYLHHSDPKTTQSYAKDHSEDVINDMFDF